MTTMTNLHSRIQEYDAKIKALRTELTEQFKQDFKVICTDIFTKYPDVLKFGWTQYTPYFNDGEPCVFNYNEIYFCMDPETADSDMYDWASTYDLKTTHPELVELDKVLRASEDVLLSLFGDHVQVTVTPAGIDVDEYEHD